jgi:hypothetical protein
VPALLVYVGCWGKTGRHLLAMSSSPELDLDPTHDPGIDPENGREVTAPSADAAAARLHAAKRRRTQMLSTLVMRLWPMAAR